MVGSHNNLYTFIIIAKGSFLSKANCRILLSVHNMLVCIHYGSTNETYKIAYEKQALAPCLGEYQFYEMRELQGLEAQAHSMRFLWILPREKGAGSDKKDGKETKESKSKKG